MSMPQNSYPTNVAHRSWEARTQMMIAQLASNTPFGLPLERAQFDHRNIGAVLPPLARALHDEIQAATQGVSELIVAEMIGTTSAAVQCLFDVEYRDKIHCPASTFVIYTAGSGNRKSTINDELTQAHRDFQASESAGTRNQHELEAEMTIWKARKRTLSKEIDGKLNDLNAVEELQMKLARHLKENPASIKMAPNIIEIDVTYAALSKNIENQSPCTSWINDDATPIFSDLRRLMPQLTRLWDGRIIKRERMTSDPVYQAEPRLSIAWGMQPQRFKKYLKENGSDFHDVGMATRTLIVQCRPLEPNPKISTVNVVREARDRHHANLLRIFTRFSEMLRAGNIERKTLTLSYQALTQFDETCGWIEANKGKGGCLEKITEFANRLPENILRVAANLHIIEERDGLEITTDIMTSAIQLMIFFTEQHKALFGDINTPIEERHADSVFSLLMRVFNEVTMNRYYSMNEGISVRWIQQRACGEDIRKKRDYVVAALKVLNRRGAVYLHDGPQGLIGVTLNPNYFYQKCQNWRQPFSV